ncbi:MAG: type II toxin-antitoxin system VapC family toxin [Arcicella sp.]|jgi:hypothetical protein|nr:type II toxin-antitoxin system VapC family toxin [Arcicella sp.]
MNRYLIDTNIVSDYLSELLPDVGMDLMDNIINAVPNLSIISQIELLSWKTDSVSEQKVKDFLKDSEIYNIDFDVVKQSVHLRRKRKMKTPDAIIAGTALSNGFILITDNERDFANIKGLKIINPLKL